MDLRDRRAGTQPSAANGDGGPARLGVFFLDEEGRFRASGRGAESLFGPGSAEFHGRPLAALFAPDAVERGEPARALARAAAEGCARDAGWMRRGDGSPFHGELILAPLAGGGFVALAFERGDPAERDERSPETEEALALFVAEARDAAVFFLDAEGRIASWNAGAERLHGWRADEVVGRGHAVLHPEERRAAGDAGEALREAARAGRAERCGWRARADGSRFWASEILLPRLPTDGAPPGYAVFVRDETDRKKAEALSLRDGLTGLPNRDGFALELRRAVEAEAAGGVSFAVLLVNLDRFATVYRALGHEAGDGLLRAVARRLEGLLRPGDTLARVGGDEFALLRRAVPNLEDPGALAERIHRSLRAPIRLDGREVFATASIGIAAGPEGRANPDDLLREASGAMRRAKAHGASRTARFDDDMRAAAAASARLEGDLGKALERRELALVYQPIVSLASGAIESCEALLRWAHPERGAVSPAEFVPLAEEVGLIVPIGEWVLREACGQARAWAREGLRRIGVAVNLSAVQLRRTDFLPLVESALAESGIDPGDLHLELTESAALADPEWTLATLSRLREAGVRLSIDDFGTGYSSLAHLQRLPITGLKIDRSFVSGMGAATPDAAIVRMVLRLARHMGLEVVAEGVETEAQARSLRARRCARAQGYLFGKPLPADGFAERLRAAAG